MNDYPPWRILFLPVALFSFISLASLTLGVLKGPQVQLQGEGVAALLSYLALLLIGLSSLGLWHGPVTIRLNRERFLGNFAGSAWLWPFIIIAGKSRNPSQEYLLRHESTHFYQACELFVVGAPVLYAYYMLKGRWQTGSWRDAYRFHPMELEAQSVGVGMKRLPFGWRHYRW